MLVYITYNSDPQNPPHLCTHIIDARAIGDINKRLYPRFHNSIAFLTNFPTLWKFAVNIFTTSSGYTFDMEIVPGTDLRDHQSITKILDVSILPKAIGGDAAYVNEETGEEDVHYCRSVTFPKLSTFLKRL